MKLYNQAWTNKDGFKSSVSILIYICFNLFINSTYNSYKIKLFDFLLFIDILNENRNYICGDYNETANI
jgi:hypothetical protein